MRFLHISDLHFGFDKGETAIAQRANYMDTLLDKLQSITDTKPIDYIFITGDIGWHAEKTDYETALVYIKDLMERCKVDAQHVFVCPGNHDVDRNMIADKAFPSDQKKARKQMSG